MSAWQSGHRPLQRARTYGLDGAFPTRLQPQLLECYDHVSTRWHEFLHLPSKLEPRAPYPTSASSGTGQQHALSVRVSSGHDSDTLSGAPSLLPSLSPTLAVTPYCMEVGRGQNPLKRPAEAEATPSRERKSRQRTLRQTQEGTGQVSCTWPAGPIFGQLNEVASAEAVEERLKIMSHLRERQAEIRTLNETDAEIVCPKDADSSGSVEDIQAYIRANPWFVLNERLGHILETAEEWRFVGCELCFAETGRREPDHVLDQCHQWPACKPAKRILRWLECLAIPRFFGRRGNCSICGHGWVVCDEMRMGYRIDEALSSRGVQGSDTSLVEEYDSKPGPDGYCRNKPVVRRMVAALCAYNDQLLGKILTEVALDYDGIDLASESHARQWFEQRIRSPDDFWVPRLLHVLDQLILAFNFRKSQQPAPEQSIATLDWSRPARWDNELEVQDWRAALDWLEGKCTFCAGRGLADKHIRHTLRQCKRGGSSYIRRELGEMFYDEGFLPSNGCKHCHLPRHFCSRWSVTDQGKWVLEPEAECSYSRYLLCDGVIGFASCGVRSYQDDLLDGIEGYLEKEGDEPPYNYDDETTAAWLVQPLEVAGAEGSEMIRQLCIWIWSLDEFKLRA